MLIRHMKRQHNGMAQPSGGGDGRRLRPRPRNGTAPGATRRRSAVEAMVARTEAELGPVTILVNNAGVSWQGTLDTYEQEQVARMHRVNVDGVIHATRAVVGSMRVRRYGRIIN